MILMIEDWDKFIELVEEHFDKCDEHKCVGCSGLVIYSDLIYLGKSGKA